MIITKCSKCGHQRLKVRGQHGRFTVSGGKSYAHVFDILLNKCAWPNEDDWFFYMEIPFAWLELGFSRKKTL